MPFYRQNDNGLQCLFGGRRLPWASINKVIVVEIRLESSRELHLNPKQIVEVNARNSTLAPRYRLGVAACPSVLLKCLPWLDDKHLAGNDIEHVVHKRGTRRCPSQDIDQLHHSISNTPTYFRQILRM